MSAGGVLVRRVYDDPGPAPGEYRVLVDRLWPRGLRKDALDADEWCQQVAPSTSLRRWYGHDPEKFPEFARRYRAELKEEPGAPALAELRRRAGRQVVVLLTATRDVDHSGAEVLREVLAAGR